MRYLALFAVGLGLTLAIGVVGVSSPGASGSDQSSTQIHYLEITIPLQVGINPAMRPPVATYVWRTIDGSPDPAEVRWIMINTNAHNNDWNETENYIRNNPDAPEWSAWQTYSPPAGTYWTSPPMDFGQYVFAVQGRDGSGIAEQDFDISRNMRRVIVSARSTGPLFVVKGTGIDSIITTIVDTPPAEIELPADTETVYCWTADASDYGGVVTGYRYGWDIADPDDDSQWDMPFTPFVNPEECSPPKTFFTGMHSFHAEVIDNDSFKSRVTILITYVPDVPVEKTTWGRVKSEYVE